jgi:hypothetical protein
MTTEELAEMIATGEVPLAVRMRQDPADEPALLAAEDARTSGAYDDMTVAEVLAKLQANAREAAGEP